MCEMLFLLWSTPEVRKRKHSEHFSQHQEPMGSQRADRTYRTYCSLFLTCPTLTVYSTVQPPRYAPIYFFAAVPVQTLSNLQDMQDPVTWRFSGSQSFWMNTKPPQRLLTVPTYVCTARKLIQPCSQWSVHSEMCWKYGSCFFVLCLISVPKPTEYTCASVCLCMCTAHVLCC